jgi:anti-sigma factor RsiW
MTPTDRFDSLDPVSKERIVAYLDDALSPDEARDVLARLEADPALLRDVEELRRAWSLLSLYADEPVPEGFADRVLAEAGVRAGTRVAGTGAVPAAESTRPRLRVLAGGKAWMAAAAAVVLGVSVLALVKGRTTAVPSMDSALEAVPAELLDAENLTALASLSDDEFETLLSSDPDDPSLAFGEQALPRREAR